MPVIQLLPYQKKWIEDNSRFKIAMQARQTGKTFTSTLEIISDCILAATSGKKKRWIILSRGERQAREAMEVLKQHAKANQFWIESKEYPDIVTQDNILEVSLSGGSRITAVPANPDTARGFSGNVFLDEFAFHQDSKKIWMALFPVISAGHKIRIASTPNGKLNKFYELMTDDSGLWSKHLIDIYEAKKQGLPRDVEELRTALGDDEAWAQEYELQWLDEAFAWLSFELIGSCESAIAGNPDHYSGHTTYIGVDIGRRRDLWVATVLEKVGQIFWLRDMVILKNQPFSVQSEVLDQLIIKYRPYRVAVDQGGMGEVLVEQWQQRYGISRIEGVMFTSKSKQSLASIIKKTFQDNKIRIPIDPNLKLDLHKVQKTVTLAGNVRYEGERDKDGHADRFWSIALALHAGTPLISTVPRANSRTLSAW